MKPIRLAFPIARGLPASTLPISEETARELFTPEHLAAGESPLETETGGGPWRTLRSVSGLVIESETARELLSPYAPSYCRTGVILHGRRTLSAPRSLGYEIEGHVSIGGKKRRAFTSSLLFRLPSGRLLCAGVLYV